MRQQWQQERKFFKFVAGGKGEFLLDFFEWEALQMSIKYQEQFRATSSSRQPGSQASIKFQSNFFKISYNIRTKHYSVCRSIMRRFHL